MEHSALHVIQLIGLLLALGGPVYVLALLNPKPGGLDKSVLQKRAGLVVAAGALASASAAALDLLVQTAELTGSTIWAGVDPGLLRDLVFQSQVGRTQLARATVLLVLAAVACRGRHSQAGWWLIAALGIVALALTTLVSHAAAQPEGRAAALLLQGVHLSAAAVWLGVLMHLLAARPLLQTHRDPSSLLLTAELVGRFSPVALGAAMLLLFSGAMAAARFIGNPAALVTSAYGLTLLIKLGLLAVVLRAASTNYLVIRPALRTLASQLQSAPQPSPNAAATAQNALVRFGKLLELETTAGILVVAVAGILASVSPPLGPGTQQLTKAQASAFLQPAWPRLSPPHTLNFINASERTLDDRKYSEFTHNISGLAIILLAALWLVQSAGGPAAALAARLWPWFLVLFGVFVAGASDVEIWILRTMPPWDALTKPQLLEHQIGAVLLFLLAGFGWRDRLRPIERRPLGCVLPVAAIFGSFLLLGHAHSSLNADAQLTSLINARHAVMGGIGLFAGTTRWLNLRGLVPERPSSWVWAALIMILGIYMAFFYRETW